MISYNFITPVDDDDSVYYWFQHYNTDPDNEAVEFVLFLQVFNNRLVKSPESLNESQSEFVSFSEFEVFNESV